MSELTLASSPLECHEDEQILKSVNLVEKQNISTGRPPHARKKHTTVHFHVTATSERSSNKRYSGLVVSDVRLVLAPL